MIKHLSNNLNSTNTWYLDSCALRYIYNNQDLFSKLWFKNYEFIKVGDKVIQSQEIGIIYLPLWEGKISLFNVTYAPNCDFNLILLGQLHDSEILYYDHPDSIILK